MKWNETTLWNKDKEWLHKGEAVVSADGDTHMDESGAAKRPADSDANPSQPKKDAQGNKMDAAPPTGEGALVTKTSAANPGSNGTGETPVDLGTPRELGIFTETRTAYLPIKFGFSFNKLINSAFGTNTFKIRLNSPYNILRDTVFTQQTEGGAVQNGVGTHQAQAYNMTTGNNPGPLTAFETTLYPATEPTASTSGALVVGDDNCRPAWRKWYEKMYESYHTIETHYKLTFFNPETTIGRRANVYIEKDVYTASSTGNIMPTNAGQFYLNTQWRDIEQIIVPERNNSSNEGFVKVHQGTWKPGTWSRNTLNSEDVKAWYATGAEPSPNWVENLVIGALTDEFNINEYSNLNVLVELTYVVQFKDLKQAFRYPQAIGTAVTFSTPFVPASGTAADIALAAGDILQTPHTQMGWGSQV